MEPDVIFVGAGPVGLLTAIQTKLYNPEATILMLEKYEKYKREHPLSIDPASYQGSHPDPRFQALIKELSGNIRTQEIEERLLEFAKELGIQIEKKVTVTRCEDMSCPQLKVIVMMSRPSSIIKITCKN